MVCERQRSDPLPFGWIHRMSRLTRSFVVNLIPLPLIQAHNVVADCVGLAPLDIVDSQIHKGSLIRVTVLEPPLILVNEVERPQLWKIDSLQHTNSRLSMGLADAPDEP